MSTQKLLPLTSSSQNSPIPIGFNLKITRELQEKFQSCKGKLKVIITNGEITLKLGDELISLNHSKEQSKVHIYKQFSSSTFKSIGIIHSKLNPKPIIKKPEETQSTTSTATSTSTPTGPNHQRNRSNGSNPSSNHNNNNHSLLASGSKISQISKKLIHILALGPITLQELHQRTKISIQDIESVLRSISMIYTPRTSQQFIIKEFPKFPRDFNETDRYFVLNYGSYKELKLGSYNTEDLTRLKQNCKLVFDYLNYPSNHPARQALKEIKDIPKEPKSTRPLKSRESSIPKEDSTTQAQATALPLKKPIKKSPSPPVSSSFSSSSSTKPQDSRKRSRSSSFEDEEYYQNLAQRFKSKYKEYQKLYKSIELLKRQKGKDGFVIDKEYKKLVELHKDLEIWKKQLWKSVQQ